MGGKKKTKGGAGKNARTKSRKNTAQLKGPSGRAGVAHNDFRAGHFGGPTQGSGTQNNTYVQQYAPVPTALASLPPLPPEFTGREDDLAFLRGVLDPALDGRPAVAVLAGLPGVGKTTLVHAAGHDAQEQGWFSGVLLVGLRGYEPIPAQPEDVLDALLRAMGVQPEHIPPTASERAALYRSQLDGRARAGERLLVIADNAWSVEQVRPLLPPGQHGLLVTSRRSLPGLGRMRTLNLLQPEDAVALLDAALKNADPEDTRVEDDPGAAEQVVLSCECLPLALQITAALLAADPGQPLAERAKMLTRSEGRLEDLDDGERSLKAAFDQSLDRMPLQQVDLFCLLSLNAGPDISTAAAATLAGESESATERLLSQLATAHLIQRGATRGRWQMHDLLRDYATEQAAARTRGSRPTRRRYDQARTRLITYYMRTTEAADAYFRDPGKVTPAHRFENRLQALEWLDAERANLIATAHAEGVTPIAARLAFALGAYLDWRRRLQDLVAVRALALDACQTVGDTRNEAGAWNGLGLALREVRRFDEAITALETAHTLHREQGDTHGEAGAWNNLGTALKDVRRFDEAITAHETARALFREQGDTQGEAGAWNNLGTALWDVRRFDEAITAHETARALFREQGDTQGEAGAWNNLGAALGEVRRLDEAITAHETARALFREQGDTHGEATAWNNLGLALRDVRRFDEAITALETAHTLHREQGDTHGEAGAWNNLGAALGEVRRFDEAITAHETARALFREQGDTQGEAGAWNNLGAALRDVRRFDEAITALETARALFREQGDTQGEAGAWNNLGAALGKVRRFDEAITAHETARTLHREQGDTQGEATAWNNLGLALRDVRRFDEAITAHETARTLHREQGDTHSEATAWNNLGTALRAKQRFHEAASAGERAAAMLDRERDPFRAGEALEELAVTLTAANADAAEVRSVWLRAASAYERANAAQEAANARAEADKRA